MMTSETSPVPAKAQQTARLGRVLVVDDDAAVLEALELALTSGGHEVVMADSGHAAVDVVRHMDVDVVLTDFKMADMDGLETMLAIKEVKPSVPVVIVTGFASAEMEEEFRRRGAFDTVMKPFSLDDLYAAIGRALHGVH